MAIMDYVRGLEVLDSRGRGERVMSWLAGFSIEAAVQQSRWPSLRNIIVDWPPGEAGKKLLFTAHYDVLRGRPGANDNASGVAVLLSLCEHLGTVRVPLRLIFFDREEVWLRTPLVHFGLLGSLWYVLRRRLRDVSAVYNLEACGLGDLLAIWSVRSGEAAGAVSEVKRAAERLSLPCRTVHVPWPALSSDHLSFRLRGVSDAVTLSLLPSSLVPELDSLLRETGLLLLLGGRRPRLPSPLSDIHTARDVSTRLSEESLQLTKSLLLELVRGHDALVDRPHHGG